VPGRDEIVVLEKLGKVSHYAFDGNAATLLGSFELPVFTETDCGLISVAFAPDFPITQHVYLGYCTTLKSSQIARFSFDLPYEEMAASEELVIANPEPAASEAWHNVGSIGFEPSGVLWALFGEKTISANGQDTSNLGKPHRRNRAPATTPPRHLSSATRHAHREGRARLARSLLDRRRRLRQVRRGELCRRARPELRVERP
jgi:glucose/arabinose dehydrogenase